MKSNKDEEELLALCRRRNWTSTSVSRLRQLTETTLATVAVPRKVSCEDDVVRATDGMKSMFQMANLIPTIAGDNADDDGSKKKKKKNKKNKTKKGEEDEQEEEEEVKELNINCQDRDGHTPLMLICIHAACGGGGGGGEDTSGNLMRECVHIVLSHPETNVNLRSNDGNNALHLLCSRSNSSSSEQQQQMLSQVARMLIENGIDADDTNGKGRTALQLMQQQQKGRGGGGSSSSKSSLVQYLVSKSTPPDADAADDDDDDVNL